MTVREHIEIIDNPVVLAIEEKDKHVITELNCGTFNYADLHIALVYVYVLA